jgi:hypothetical protein
MLRTDVDSSVDSGVLLTELEKDLERIMADLKKICISGVALTSVILWT